MGDAGGRIAADVQEGAKRCQKRVVAVVLIVVSRMCVYTCVMCVMCVCVCVCVCVCLWRVSLPCLSLTRESLALSQAGWLAGNGAGRRLTDGNNVQQQS